LKQPPHGGPQLAAPPPSAMPPPSPTFMDKMTGIFGSPIPQIPPPAAPHLPPEQAKFLTEPGTADKTSAVLNILGPLLMLLNPMAGALAMGVGHNIGEKETGKREALLKPAMETGRAQEAYGMELNRLNQDALLKSEEARKSFQETFGGDIIKKQQEAQIADVENRKQAQETSELNKMLAVAERSTRMSVQSLADVAALARTNAEIAGRKYGYDLEAKTNKEIAETQRDETVKLLNVYGQLMESAPPGPIRDTISTGFLSDSFVRMKIPKALADMAGDAITFAAGYTPESQKPEDFMTQKVLSGYAKSLHAYMIKFAMMSTEEQIKARSHIIAIISEINKVRNKLPKPTAGGLWETLKQKYTGLAEGMGSRPASKSTKATPKKKEK